MPLPQIGGTLDDYLYQQHERVVSRDNCVQFEGSILQIPATIHRCHYVKAKVKTHHDSQRNLAIFHEPPEIS